MRIREGHCTTARAFATKHTIGFLQADAPTSLFFFFGNGGGCTHRSTRTTTPDQRKSLRHSYSHSRHCNLELFRISSRVRNALFYIAIIIQMRLLTFPFSLPHPDRPFEFPQAFIESGTSQKRNLAMLSCLLLATAASALPEGVPPSFDCAMRQAAYSFGKQLVPRHDSFPELYSALGLDVPTTCGGEHDKSVALSPPEGGRVHPQAAPPTPTPTINDASALFVDPVLGDDRASGTRSAPLLSLQAALDLVAVWVIPIALFIALFIALPCFVCPAMPNTARVAAVRSGTAVSKSQVAK